MPVPMKNREITRRSTPEENALSRENSIMMNTEHDSILTLPYLSLNVPPDSAPNRHPIIMMLVTNPAWRGVREKSEIR